MILPFRYFSCFNLVATNIVGTNFIEVKKERSKSWHRDVGPNLSEKVEFYFYTN